jgi:hypothetical protein
MVALAFVVVPGSWWLGAAVLLAVGFTMLVLAHGIGATGRLMRQTAICGDCGDGSDVGHGDRVSRRRLLGTSLRLSGAALVGSLFTRVDALGEHRGRKGHVEASVSGPNGFMATVYASEATLVGHRGRPRILNFRGVVARPDLGGSVPLTLRVRRRDMGRTRLVHTGVPNEYRVTVDGKRSALVVRFQTYKNMFKRGGRVHAGIVTNTRTGERYQFVIDNDPVPVIVVVAVFLTPLLAAAACTASAAVSCGVGNVCNLAYISASGLCSYHCKDSLGKC